jgi:predicted Zn finger-like uncharacterized protein
MILTCPACDTSYFVPDTAIGPNGRRVRCKSCGHDWRATAEDEPLELSPATDKSPEAVVESAAEPVSDSLAETPAPALSKAFRAREERRRRMRQAATQGAAWVGLAVVVLGLIIAAIAFRLPVVQAWPQTASFYKNIGFPVNLTGVEVEALRGKTLIHAPDKVVIGGALRNIRDNEVVPPDLVIVLRDTRGVEVVRHPLKLDGPPILPGKVQGFAAVVANPEGRGSAISIDFVMPSDAVPAAPKITKESGPKPRPLPTPDGGLRPIELDNAVAAPAVPLDKKGV